MAKFQGNSNSGRKSAYEEHNKTQAINKLWLKVNEKITKGVELDDYEKELVVKLLPKTIKTEVDVTSGGEPMPLLGGQSQKPPEDRAKVSKNDKQ